MRGLVRTGSGGTLQPNADGSIPVTTNGSAPLELAVPQILSANAPQVTLDAGSGKVILYAGIIINPLDDVIAAQRFLDGDYDLLNAEGTLSKQTGSPITDVYLLGFGDDDAGGVIDRGTQTLANVLAQQTHWTFFELDNVKSIQVQSSPFLTSAQILDVTLRGGKSVN